MIIRPACGDDREDILRVVADAFEGGEEVGLVRSVWASDGYVPDLDLVAEEDGSLLGHVLCSLGDIEGSPALGLAPLCVRPDRQRDGVGSALMREVIARADARGDALILLLGHPSYYPRFGFRPARELGVTYLPDPAPDPDPFMALPLAAYDPSARGRFRYAFD